MLNWRRNRRGIFSTARFKINRYLLNFTDIPSPRPGIPGQVILIVDGGDSYYWNYGQGRDTFTAGAAIERIYTLYWQDLLAARQPLPTGEFGEFFLMMTVSDGS